MSHKLILGHNQYQQQEQSNRQRFLRRQDVPGITVNNPIKLLLTNNKKIIIDLSSEEMDVQMVK